MTVTILIVLAIISYTAFGLFAAKAGGKINDNLGASIFNGIGAVIPLVVYFLFRAKQHTQNTSEGIVYSILAGVSIAIFAILLTNIFSRAENVSFVIPAIYGGTIVLATIAGVLVFKESISTLGLSGVVLTAIGISMLILARLTA